MAFSSARAFPTSAKVASARYASASLRRRSSSDHRPTASLNTVPLPPPRITLASRISLVLLGLMVSLPFLNFHHSFPLPTFYTEWISFALGAAALVALVFAPRGQDTRIPILSLGL